MKLFQPENKDHDLSTTRAKMIIKWKTTWKINSWWVVFWNLDFKKITFFSALSKALSSTYVNKTETKNFNKKIFFSFGSNRTSSLVLSWLFHIQNWGLRDEKIKVCACAAPARWKPFVDSHMIDLKIKSKCVKNKRVSGFHSTSLLWKVSWLN